MRRKVFIFVALVTLLIGSIYCLGRDTKERVICFDVGETLSCQYYAGGN